MLLVALVALGSATFAWFTVSKTVTANEMQVKAIAAAGLEISNTGANGTYTTSVSFGQTNDSTNYQLKPVSWNGSTGTGFIPNGNVTDTEDGTYSGAFKAGASASPSAAATGVAKGHNDNFAIYKVWVRSAADNGTYTPHTQITAKVTIGSGDAAGFARCKFIDNTTAANTKIFATDASTTNSVVTATPSTKGTYTTVAHNVDTAATDTDNTAVGKEYTLIVWFDGEDTDCKDAAKGEVADITITFTAGDM